MSTYVPDELLIAAVKTTDSVLPMLFGPDDGHSSGYNQRGLAGSMGTIVRDNLIDYAEHELSASLNPSESLLAGSDASNCSPLEAALYERGRVFLAAALLEDKAEEVRITLLDLAQHLREDARLLREEDSPRAASPHLPLPTGKQHYADVLDKRAAHLEQLAALFELKKKELNNDDFSSNKTRAGSPRGIR